MFYMLIINTSVGQERFYFCSFARNWGELSVCMKSCLIPLLFPPSTYSKKKRYV